MQCTRPMDIPNSQLCSRCLEEEKEAKAGQELIKPDGDTVCHQLQAGDSWGSRALKEARLTHGKITALEDTKLLLVNSEDFQRLRNTYEPLNDLLTAAEK